MPVSFSIYGSAMLVLLVIVLIKEALAHFTREKTNS
jgi:hypothetical protein